MKVRALGAYARFTRGYFAISTAYLYRAPRAIDLPESLLH